MTKTLRLTKGTELYFSINHRRESGVKGLPGQSQKNFRLQFIPKTKKSGYSGHIFDTLCNKKTCSYA